MFRPLPLVALVLAALAAAPVASAAAPNPQVCTAADIAAVSELTPGTTATGWTVVSGTEPVSFDVTVLGTLPSGIAPGLDFVAIKVSGPAMDETGGIFPGISGSPVYLADGRLAGSVSYGFFGDQTVAGMTPAEPIIDILSYPRAAASLPLGGLRAPAARVRLPEAFARHVAARADADAGGSAVAVARQLPVPLSVSGMNERALGRLARVLHRHGVRVLPFRGGAAAGAPAAAPDPAAAGDSVAASISYGDFTVAGIGTATAVCDDGVMSFGHPFLWDGSTTLGLNEAPVVAIVPNPGNAFGGFKLASVGGVLGTVDQDRLAGIRAISGELPASTAVTSSVAVPELGNARDGGTTAIPADLMPLVAAFHMVVNIDRVFDHFGEGSSTLEWTITGTRADGSPFTLVHDNRYHSRFDISFESVFELAFQADVVQGNPFEEVRVTGIDVDASVTEADQSARITKVLSASKLQDRLKNRRVLKVKRGGVVRLRVMLKRADAEQAEPVDLRLQLPRRGGDGQLRIGGGDPDGCLFCGGSGEKLGTESFDELLAKLAGAPRNTDLGAHYRSFSGRKTADAFRALDVVIDGGRRIFLDVRGGR